MIISITVKASPICQGCIIPIDIRVNNAEEVFNLAVLNALARSVIPYFRVSKTKADTIIEVVRNAVKNWRAIAGKLGLSKKEQDLMEGAFVNA